MATCVVFDVCAFRHQFTNFSLANGFSDAQLQVYFDIASAYIDKQYGANCFLNDAQLTLALYTMTAHIAALYQQANTGQTTGVVTSATIDKVSVTMEPPPSKSAFSYWLNLTPYGINLAALLAVCTAGGKYYGGRPELAAFRRQPR